MSALDKKLLRDVRRLKGQIATIATVLGCGIMAIVMLRSTLASLMEARDTYYREGHFADVFARLERAPERVADQIERIPGVARVETRVVQDVMLPLEDDVEPVLGRVVSLSERGLAFHNRLYLTRGRLPDETNANEIVLLDQFAKAHRLRPGDHLPAVLNGQRVSLEIVGCALSPEFIFAMAEHQTVADDRRFAVIWMPRSQLAPRFQMEGAFNDVLLSLEPGAPRTAVMDAVDRLLEPHGGFLATSRDRQLSNYILQSELNQLQSLALLTPAVFLGVAAFLVNIVLSRLVFLERVQIAVLKALGYANQQIVLHYLGLVVIIVSIGSVIGLLTGWWTGSWMTALYSTYFRFPSYEHNISLNLAMTSIAIAFLAAASGAILAVFSVTRLPPARAMRPPSPPNFRRTRFLGIARWLGPTTMMVLRVVLRNPMRFLLSSAGIAMGVGVYIMGLFTMDAFDYLMKDLYPRENRADITMVFDRPLPSRVVREAEHLPGVERAQGMRTMAVRFRFGQRSRTSLMIAIENPSALRRVIHRGQEEVPLPDEGLVMTKDLADYLGVGVQEELEVQVLDGRRRILSIPVAAIVEESFGMQAYAEHAWLHRRMGEAPAYSATMLTVMDDALEDLRKRLKELPRVVSVVSRNSVIESYEKQTGESIGVITLILTLSASAISIGVVYNNARIALSMRSRELSSLRVLGFRKNEISAMLLGEIGAQVLFGIPVGLLFGKGWAMFFAATVENEYIRFPAIVDAATYAAAAAIALLSGLISAFFVHRRLKELNLVEVLKAAE